MKKFVLPSLSFYRNLAFPLFKAQFVRILPLHAWEDDAERTKL